MEAKYLVVLPVIFSISIVLGFVKFKGINFNQQTKKENSGKISQSDMFFLRYEVRGTVNTKPNGGKNIVAVFKRGFTLLPDTKQNKEPAYNKKSLKARIENLKRNNHNYDVEQRVLINWPDNL